MSSGYTTYSSVDDRFNYTRKGVFRCRYKSEKIYIAVWIAILTVILTVSGYFTYVNFDSLASTVYSFIFGIINHSSIIWFPLCAVGGVRVIRSGTEYSFTANEEKMLIVCPRENFRTDIFYKDVRNVEYKDKLSFFKKRLRGYFVTVYCDDGIRTFDFIFPYSSGTVSLTKDLTPFRIIEERAGLLEKPEFIAGQRIDNIGV